MKTILHIPHSSLVLPEAFHDGLLISRDELAFYNYFMSDIGIDRLFPSLEGYRIMASYSRLYCDVERMRSDTEEPMATLGQGAVYTHTYDGRRFHQHDEEYEDIAMVYYDSYHAKLDRLVMMLDEDILLLDLHSFSDGMASHVATPPFPDFCIGTEEEWKSDRLITRITDAIEDAGWTWALNHPYKGSMVPSVVRKGKFKRRFVSIMIEVNKRCYLPEFGYKGDKLLPDFSFLSSDGGRRRM